MKRFLKSEHTAEEWRLHKNIISKKYTKTAKGKKTRLRAQRRYIKNHKNHKEEKRLYNKNYFNSKAGYLARQNGQLKRLYNITFDDKKRMYRKQHRICGLRGCGNRFKHIDEAQPDHNHKTGKLRRLLCRNCNVFIGWLEKYLKLLPHAMKYIKEINESQSYLKH